MTQTALTLGDAARETGLAKSTIFRAIKNGKISAVKNESGEWQIEPAELFRVFPPATGATVAETGVGNDTQRGAQHPETRGETGGVAAELQILRERMQMAGQMHEKELALLNARIEELRQDREDLRGERDRLLTTLQEQAVSVRLLTDHSPRQPTPPQDPGSPSAGQGAGAADSPSPASPRRGLFGLFRRAG
jgi:hypothetical protein